MLAEVLMVLLQSIRNNLIRWLSLDIKYDQNRQKHHTKWKKDIYCSNPEPITVN